ncbi:hypothetical protein AB4305_04285 [Nocardia sp. 2YAB30]|uniref:hypothetical protein n=1 Tax=unclassified Nocardia TaxID=2637762 RepID=UPI003F978DB0
MKSPIAETVQAATRALASAFRDTAKALSARYRATESALRSGAVGLAEADTRTQMLVKASGLAFAVGVGASVGPDIGNEVADVLAPSGDSEDLGPEVDRLVAMSPTLSKNVRELQAAGWTIGYGSIKAGGTTNRGEKKILINPDGKNDPLLITAELAHETGHATAGSEYIYSITDPGPGEDYRQWYDKNLYKAYQDESNAGLMTAKVRREILDNGGPDIDHIDDITKTSYDAYAAGDLTRQAAVDLLADHLRDHPGGYRDYYGKDLDKRWEEVTGTPPPDSPGSLPGNAGVAPGSDGSAAGNSTDIDGPYK